MFVDANVGKTIKKSKEISKEMIIIKTDCSYCKEEKKVHDRLSGMLLMFS